MKQIVIAFALALSIVACSRKADLSPFVSRFPEVSVLMEAQPDSALQLILAINDTLQMDALPEANQHEFQILIAEALYKNYYKQSNAEAVDEAATYYDSLAALHPKDATWQYQKARAHYYKGVGEQEKDEIVEACKEFLSALETMKESLNHNKMDYEQQRFLGLCCSRLGSVFENNSMSNIAMDFYRSSIDYFKPIGCARDVLYAQGHIGYSFSLMNEVDSALHYYDMTLNELDSVDPLYFDLTLQKSVLLYYFRNDKAKGEECIQVLKKSPKSNLNKRETAVYYMVMGSYFCDHQETDSPILYLNRAFEEGDGFSKFEITKLLSETYEKKGDFELAAHYNKLYSDFAEQEIENSVLTEKLAKVYREYEAKIAAQKHHQMMVTVMILVILILCLALLAFLIVMKKASKKLHVAKARNEDMSRKLKNSERTLMRHEAKHQQQLASLSQIQNRQEQTNDNKSFEDRLAEFESKQICDKIKSIANSDIQKKNLSSYKDFALDKNDFIHLFQVANNSFGSAIDKMKIEFPNLTNKDIQYCLISLLTDRKIDIAVLTDKDYSSVCKRFVRLQHVFHTNVEIGEFFKNYLRQFDSTAIVSVNI